MEVADFDAQYEAWKSGNPLPDDSPAETTEPQAEEPVAEEPLTAEAGATPSETPAPVTPKWYELPIEPLDGEDIPPSLIGKPAKELVAFAKDYAKQAHKAGFEKNEFKARAEIAEALLEKYVKGEKATQPEPKRDIYAERRIDPDVDIAMRPREVLEATVDEATARMEAKLNERMERERLEREAEAEVRRQTAAASEAFGKARTMVRGIDGSEIEESVWRDPAFVGKLANTIMARQLDPFDPKSYATAYEEERQLAARAFRFGAPAQATAAAPTVEPAANPGTPPLGVVRPASSGNATTPRKQLSQREQRQFDEMVARMGIQDKDKLLNDLLAEGN